MIDRAHFNQISGTRFFPKVWDLCKNAAINIKFRYSPNLGKKSMATFSSEFKKLNFWPIFRPFWGHKKFSCKNLGLSRSTPHGSLTPCWVSGKNYPKKTWMEGWKDGQTLIHRTLLAKAWGPINLWMFSKN